MIYVIVAHCTLLPQAASCQPSVALAPAWRSCSKLAVNGGGDGGRGGDRTGPPLAPPALAVVGAGPAGSGGRGLPAVAAAVPASGGRLGGRHDHAVSAHIV